MGGRYCSVRVCYWHAVLGGGFRGMGGAGGLTSWRCLAWGLSWQVMVCMCRCIEGCVCPVLRAPVAAGQGSLTPTPLGKTVAQVTCGFVRPMPEPLRGAQGVAMTCGVWRPLIDPEGHKRRCTECQTSCGVLVDGRPWGLPQEHSRERSPQVSLLHVENLR